MPNTANGTNGAGERKKKNLIVNAFVMMCSGHQSPGLWTHPDDHSAEFDDVDHWVKLAKLLEDAKFHGMFIADVLGGYDVFNGNLDAAKRSGAQWPVTEPLAVVAAMAAATKNIGFGVTVSTTYEQPYFLARRLSTIDHLSKGRLGWNIVTGYLESAARNLGLKELPEHDERYAICEEYIQVMYKLFESSWRDDAIVLDKKKRIYSDPTRVREINHKGKYYDVPGPHIVHPSPQRTPLLLQAGTSKAGKTFAAKHAEAIFVAAHSPSVVAGNIKEIRETAAAHGRDPQSVKFLALICPVLARTGPEAVKKFEELESYGSIEGASALFGGWTGINLADYNDDEDFKNVKSNAIRSMVDAWSKASPDIPKWTKETVAKHITVGGMGPAIVGSPSQVADELQRWVDEADVDGFNFAYATNPGTFIDIAEMLLPELKKRGMFWDDYVVPGGTYRENFYLRPGQKEPPADHPADKYHWPAGVAAEDCPIPE